jgi:hypothetical protein
VSNAYAGESAKGHRIMLAELGLAESRDRIPRYERTFEGAWSKDENINTLRNKSQLCTYAL